MKEATIRTMVRRILSESNIREADVSSGERVPFGSEEHVKDLEMRISDLSRWRDRQKRGSEARANYARVIARLKSELASAKKTLAKNQTNDVSQEEDGRQIP